MQALFRCSRLSQIGCIQKPMVTSSGIRHTSLCPLFEDLCAPWSYPTCGLGRTPLLGHCLGSMLAALPREKLSLENVPHLWAGLLWARWLSVQALFKLIGLYQRRPGEFMAPVLQWDNPMVSPYEGIQVWIWLIRLVAQDYMVCLGTRLTFYVKITSLNYARLTAAKTAFTVKQIEPNPGI